MMVRLFYFILCPVLVSIILLDINDRMPRQEAAEIFHKIKELGLLSFQFRMSF